MRSIFIASLGVLLAIVGAHYGLNMFETILLAVSTLVIIHVFEELRELKTVFKIKTRFLKGEKRDEGDQNNTRKPR